MFISTFLFFFALQESEDTHHDFDSISDDIERTIDSPSYFFPFFSFILFFFSGLMEVLFLLSFLLPSSFYMTHLLSLSLSLAEPADVAVVMKPRKPPLFTKPLSWHRSRRDKGTRKREKKEEQEGYETEEGRGRSGKKEEKEEKELEILQVHVRWRRGA
jgi:hypothetical protein